MFLSQNPINTPTTRTYAQLVQITVVCVKTLSWHGTQQIYSRCCHSSGIFLLCAFWRICFFVCVFTSVWCGGGSRNSDTGNLVICLFGLFCLALHSHDGTLLFPLLLSSLSILCFFGDFGAEDFGRQRLMCRCQMMPNYDYSHSTF